MFCLPDGLTRFPLGARALPALIRSSPKASTGEAVASPLRRWRRQRRLGSLSSRASRIRVIMNEQGGRCRRPRVFCGALVLFLARCGGGCGSPLSCGSRGRVDRGRDGAGGAALVPGLEHDRGCAFALRRFLSGDLRTVSRWLAWQTLWDRKLRSRGW